MTTRRAAKSGNPNSSPSVNGSIGDDTSRRGSLDDLRPITSYSNGSQASAKSRRLSEISASNVIPDSHMNGIHYSEQINSSEGKSKTFSPIQQSPSPSRKRKRSSSTSLQAPISEQSNKVAKMSYQNNDDVSGDGEEKDAVKVVTPEHLSDRDAPPSQASSQSERMDQDDGTRPAFSIDATPALSGQVSPATSESNSQEEYPLAKPLGAALEEYAKTQDQQEDPDDQDDAVDVGEDADDAEEVDEQVRSDEDGRPKRGRFGGRRRARHPNPRVEKAMQRQAQLKTAYRSIARSLKPVLAEIASRTIDDLETNAELHLEAMEYEPVKLGLDDAYEERKTHLNAQVRLNEEQLTQTKDAESEVVKAQWRADFYKLQDTELDRLEREMRKIIRTAALDGIDADCETEDEDDIIPRPKGMGYRWKRTGTLDSVYDSRSRLALETVQSTADMQKRFEMRKLLAELEDEDKPDELAGFTIMDNARREMAMERRQGAEAVKTIAEAAAEIERISQIPVIRNEDALGLQMLGDLASRPSIASSAPPPLRSKPSRDSFVGQTPPRPMPPPLQLHTGFGPDRIPVAMSPRTTQAMGERFDTSMPPPMTPTQGATPNIRSPEAMRTEFPAPSPTSQAPRINRLQQSPQRQSESRPVSKNGPLFEHKRVPSEPLPPFARRRPEGIPPPFMTGERLGELPQWRAYPEEQPPSKIRRLSNTGAQPFVFPQDLMGRRYRQFNLEQRPEEKREMQHSFKKELPLHRLQQYGSSEKLDKPSQSGPQEPRYGSMMSPNRDSRKPAGDMPRSPRAKPASMTSSVHDRRPENRFGDNQNRPRPKSIFKSTFPLKTNKAERDGQSRRHWSIDRKVKGSVDQTRSVGSPTTASSPFAGSPSDRAPPPVTWYNAPPPLQSPLGPPPPAATYHQSTPYGHPPPPHYVPSQHGYDFYQHRNSFPPPLQAPASIWDQPSHSHLYAVPQQHPPPPGVPPEQYSRYAPPPPPSYQPPRPPPQTPQTPHPQSAPGTYSHQFRGPPLAPATTNPGFHPPGFRPTHPPPAFAQQAQQQYNLGGPRRRTQSDAAGSMPKFHSWRPPSQR